MKKYLIIILSILIIGITEVNASEVNLYERNKENNYGVNKKWEINSNNLYNVTKTPYVDASEKIYDMSNILTDEEKLELKTEIDNFINETNMDMVILTIDMPYNYDKKNEDYAADFYDYNDFGIDFKHYSGVLILRNTYEDDPYFNIYTFGEAQLYFTYERLEDTLDDIYYDFVSHSYLDGFTKFIDDMSDYYENGVPLDYRHYYINDDGFITKKYVPPVIISFLISSVITFITMSILVRKNKMVKYATDADNYLDASTINYTVNKNDLVGSHTTHYHISSSSSSSGSSHHSSSRGSSGGGHSSGGGRHG